MSCRIISDDGWFISANTEDDAWMMAVEHLIGYADLSILEAEALLGHDMDRGIVMIIGVGHHSTQ